MKFEISPEDERFLKLAAKAACGEASDEEKNALETLMKKAPDLRRDFTRLQRAVKNEGRRRFWDLALREIFGTASSEESEEFDALALKSPKRQQEYRDAVDFLKAMSARSASMKTAKRESMPPDVQQKILESLASQNRRRI